MLHAGEKRHQASDDSESHKRFRAAVVEDEEQPCCSSSLFENNPQSLSPSETSSPSQASRRASSTTITSSGTCDTKSDQGDESEYEERSCSSEGSSPENSCSDILLMKADLLEHFLLYKYKMKQLILKEDMQKLIGEDYQDEFADVLKEASERIEAVFAVDLKEIDSSNHSYDLVSKLKLPNNGRVHTGRGLPKTGLLLNILALIFVKGNSVTEEELWKFLNEMRVYAGKRHCIYGEPRKLILKDFVQLQYLESRQVPNSNPPRSELLWGPRAYAEGTKVQVLEFLGKVKTMAPSALLPWYEEAWQDEETARGAEAARAGPGAPASQGSVAPASPTPSDA